MRCFIAIDIDDDIRSRIGSVQQYLKLKTKDCKNTITWVSPERIHLTLKFLGDVADDRINDVCEIVTGIADEYSSFDLVSRGLGCFGHPGRVLWAGIEMSKQLGSLQKDIADALEPFGFEQEKKKYAGHLTLCRVKSAFAGRIIED